MKKIRIDKGQGYLLDNFLRENTKTLNGKRPETIAKVCSTALGFEISPSTIKSIRKAMIFAGIEVWEEAPRGEQKAGLNLHALRRFNDLEQRMDKQFAEQDRKFKTIFEKLHILTEGRPMNNGDDRLSYEDPEKAKVIKELEDAWQS